MDDLIDIPVISQSFWHRLLKKPAHIKMVKTIKLPEGFCDINRNYRCGNYRIKYTKVDRNLCTGLYISYAGSKNQCVILSFTDDDLIKNSDGIYLRLKHLKRICSQDMRYEIDYDQVKTGDLVISFINSIKFTTEVDEIKIVTECISKLHEIFI